LTTDIAGIQPAQIRKAGKALIETDECGFLQKAGTKKPLRVAAALGKEWKAR